ncbi:hypothetical protein Ancab_014509 [Ancistrocladus abbreviatus]
MGNGRDRQAGSLAPNSKDTPHRCRPRHNHNHRLHLKTTLGTASSVARRGTGISGWRNSTPHVSSSAATHATAVSDVPIGSGRHPDDYGGSDQVQVGNGILLPMSHIGTGSIPTNHKPLTLSNALHV